MRARSTTVLAACSAAAGVVAVLLVAWAAGWLHGEEHTVVVREAAPPVEVANAPRVTPLIGGHFDPAAIYRAGPVGYVTIYSVFTVSARALHRARVSSSQGRPVLTNLARGHDGGRDARRRHPREQGLRRVQGPRPGRGEDRRLGRLRRRRVIKVDPKTHALAPVPLGDSSRVVVGEPVAAIGSPFGNENSLAVGVVSATQRSIESLTSQYNLVDAIQVDAPINHGNSGGPLFDALGRVIGINAQIRSDSGNAEGVGFAVPINAAKRSMAQLLANGKVSYAYVGITSEDLTPGIARRFGYPVEYGAVITSVRPGSPGARAGLHGGTDERDFNGVDFTYGGDVLVAVDGSPIRGANDVVRTVSEHLRPGQVSTFTIVRDGTRRRVRVVLGTRPGNPDAR